MHGTQIEPSMQLLDLAKISSKVSPTYEILTCANMLSYTIDVMYSVLCEHVRDLMLSLWTFVEPL